MKKIKNTETVTHFAILEMGVSIWNRWRAAEPLTVPNLRNADLSELHLENVNLCRTDLRGAKLAQTYLYDADFQDADLRGADLTRALLIGANLHGANLTGAMLKQAYLSQSDLSNANFTCAYLQKADFKDALLTGTVLVDAQVAEAEFTASFDLTEHQLNLAKDAHLACFEPIIPVGPDPNTDVKESMSREAENLTESVTEGTASAETKPSKQRKEPSPGLQPAIASGPMDVFQPVAREPMLSRPALRPLAATG